jgi:hypothetical protein
MIPRWVRQTLDTGPVETTDRLRNARLSYDETLTLVANAVVCVECNHGLLRRLGELVRPDVDPMIVGTAVVLSPARGLRHQAPSGIATSVVKNVGL